MLNPPEGLWGGTNWVRPSFVVHLDFSPKLHLQGACFQPKRASSISW